MSWAEERFWRKYDRIAKQLEELEMRVMNLELRVIGKNKPSDLSVTHKQDDDWAADLDFERGTD